MSGKANGKGQPTSLVLGQSCADNTAMSEMTDSLEVNPPPPTSQQDPEMSITLDDEAAGQNAAVPLFDESQQDDPATNDDANDESSDDDELNFYQMEFLSNGTFTQTGTPSPMAMQLASMVTGFLANRIAQRSGDAAAPSSAGYDGSHVSASGAAASSESKGAGKRNAKAAPRSKRSKNICHKKKF